MQTVRSPAKQRTVEAALELFAEHGVHGTSLQMIADALGVTKAAVYHQFRTKDEIVIAVADHEMTELEAAVEEAEAAPTRRLGRELLLRHMIDFAITRRQMMQRTLQGDPVIMRVLDEHPPFRALTGRMYKLLLDEHDTLGAGQRVATAILTSAITGVVTHPLVADLDDETLRAELMRYVRRLVNLPANRRGVIPKP